MVKITEKLRDNVQDFTTLSGVVENATHLGAFSGTTISDNVSIKAAIQSLETAVEAGGGASVFTDLTDTPADFIGHGSKAVRVNAGATALEFVTFPSGADNLGNHIATEDIKMQGFGLDSNVSDGAAAVAHILDTDNVINTAGSKILSVRSSGAERMAIQAGTHPYGVTGTQLKLDRQAGGDELTIQAGSGAVGDYSSISPKNPWGLGLHAAVDFAGFTGGVTDFQLSPAGGEFAGIFSPNGLAEINMRTWDWADLGWSEFALWRNGMDDYESHWAVIDSTITEAATIGIKSANYGSTLGITDTRIRMKCSNTICLALGETGIGVKAALFVDNTKVVGSQGAVIGNATDAASVITQLNLLLARCRAHGLIAT